MRITFALWAIIIGSLLSGCSSSQNLSSTQSTPAPPTLYEWDSFRKVPYEEVLLAGQPSPEALDTFVSSGGVMVINLRTEREMTAFPNHQSEIESRGLRYVHIPASGSQLGAPHYQALAQALEQANGPVLLHCASGGRATYAWGMKRIAQEDLTAEQAIEWCEQVRGSQWETGSNMLHAFSEEYMQMQSIVP